MTDYAKLTPEVAKHFWGEPNKLFSTRTELRWGSKGSRSVDLEKGTWYDHEEGIGGGCIALVEVYGGLAGAAAHKWLEQEGWVTDAPRTNGAHPHAAHHSPPPGAKPTEIARYTYTDDRGEPVLQVRRFEWPANNGSKPAKTFGQYRPDGKGGWLKGIKGHGIVMVPYRLPELLAAIADGAVVFVVEGEKKVEALEAIGVPATCNVGGSGKWGQWDAYFRGADVVVLPDNDDVGRKHAAQVAHMLAPTAKRVRVVDLPGLGPKEDVADWIGAGGTVEHLFALARDAKPLAQADPVDEGDQWHTLLHRNQNGVLKATEWNIRLTLMHHPDLAGLVEIDTFSNVLISRRLLEIEGLSPYDQAYEDPYPRELKDRDVMDLWHYFQTHGYPTIGKQVVELALEAEASKHPRHPPREYLQSLKWDGVNRVHRWLEYYCGAECEDEQERAYVSAVGMRWLVQAVARVFNPGCKADFCLILEGPQGVGKSTTFKILGGPWFSDALPADLHQRDTSLHLRGKWIIELSELSALSRSEMETTKSFLSRDVDKYRPPYGRVEVTYARQCVFGGSTNDSSYLKDDTGARRFWPVKVGSIDLPSLRAERDQLWAEAYQLYRDGVRWWFDSEVDMDLINTAHMQQESRYDVDSWEESLKRYCASHGEVTVGEILSNVFGRDVANHGKSEQMRVVKILGRLGYKKGRRSANVRHWARNGSFL